MIQEINTGQYELMSEMIDLEKEIDDINDRLDEIDMELTEVQAAVLATIPVGESITVGNTVFTNNSGRLETIRFDERDAHGIPLSAIEQAAGETH